MRLLQDILELIIDDEDYPKLQLWGWCIITNEKGHRVVGTKGEFFNKQLSRLLINAPHDLLCDHRDGNPLNNQKNNLRLATYRQNRYNSLGHKNKKSGLPKGIYKRGNLFRVTTTFYGIQRELGMFKTLEEAVVIREQAIDRLQGDYALHNSRP